MMRTFAFTVQVILPIMITDVYINVLKDMKALITYVFIAKRM